MTNAEIISLKEYIESKIAALDRVIESRFDANDMALKLQGKEYERRLDFLNGEAERLRKMQETYLPREVWESHHLELEKVVAELKEFRANAQGRNTVLTVVISALISLGFALLNYLLTKL